MIKFGRIWSNLTSNLVEFDHKIRIRPNSTFKFKYELRKIEILMNSNKFVRAYRDGPYPPPSPSGRPLQASRPRIVCYDFFRKSFFVAISQQAHIQNTNF